MAKLFLKNSNLCDHNSPTSQTDRRTDGQTTCDRNTALCTKVHRAVKTQLQIKHCYLDPRQHVADCGNTCRLYWQWGFPCGGSSVTQKTHYRPMHVVLWSLCKRSKPKFSRGFRLWHVTLLTSSITVGLDSADKSCIHTASYSQKPAGEHCRRVHTTRTSGHA